MKTSRHFLILAAASCLGLVGGCSTPQSRIAANPAAFNRLTPDQQALVRAGKVGLGFDGETVKLALGDPDRVTIRTTAQGQTQIWHYTTYEDNGVILYSGYYHRWGWGRGWGWGGDWWGPAYPYYLDYPYRQVYDRFRIVFTNGRVTSIEEDTPR